jgi:hypothetical protein
LRDDPVASTQEISMANYDFANCELSTEELEAIAAGG